MQVRVHCSCFRVLLWHEYRKDSGELFTWTNRNNLYISDDWLWSQDIYSLQHKRSTSTWITKYGELFVVTCGKGKWDVRSIFGLAIPCNRTININNLVFISRQFVKLFQNVVSQLRVHVVSSTKCFTFSLISVRVYLQSYCTSISYGLSTPTTQRSRSAELGGRRTTTTRRTTSRVKRDRKHK